jgi:hypothetical protein
MGSRNANGVYNADYEWAASGDKGKPAGINRTTGWPLSYSQAGGDKPERILFNELYNNLFAATIDMNKYGATLPYSAGIDYDIGAYVQGSDFNLYLAAIANGPGSSVVNPVGDTTGTWLALLFTPEALRNDIDGITLSNNTTDPLHDIDFATGQCRLGSGLVVQNLSIFVKRIDATWASGTGNGGLAAGVSLSPNTWYHCFVMCTNEILVPKTDFGFDTSITGSNLLTDAAVIAYGLKQARYLGSVLTDGSSDIIEFFQWGDWFFWKEPILDYSGAQSTSAVLQTVSMPVDVRCLGLFNNVLPSAGGSGIYLSSPDSTDLAPSQTVSPLVTLLTGGSDSDASIALVLSNINSQIRRRSLTTDNVRIANIGYMNYRARNGE